MPRRRSHQVTRRSALAALAHVLLLASAVGRVSAQRRVDVDWVRPSWNETGFLTVPGTRTPGHLRVTAGLWASWSNEVLHDNDQELVDHRLRSHAQAYLGLGERAVVGLDVPVVLYQNGTQEGAATALSDPWLSARYRIIGARADSADPLSDGGGVSLRAASSLPIGSLNAWSGEGAVRTELGATADLQLLGAAVGISATWQHRFHPRRVADTTLEDDLRVGLALRAPIPVLREFWGYVEALGRTNTADLFGRRRSGAQLGAGLGLARWGLLWRGGAMVGLTGPFGTPAVTAMLGATWSPQAPDADGDGVPDDEDTCAHLAEDVDGFEDADGCPDPDNDNDLVLDEDDRCPLEPAEEGRDEDFDGCTDAA